MAPHHHPHHHTTHSKFSIRRFRKSRKQKQYLTLLFLIPLINLNLLIQLARNFNQSIQPERLHRSHNHSHLLPTLTTVHVPSTNRQVPPFNTRSTTLATSPIANSSIDAVLFCHYSNPCCISENKALPSLIRQTVFPTSFVFLHSCHLPSDRSLLYHALNDVLRHSTFDTFIHRTTDSYCPADSQLRYEECLLRYLSDNPHSARYRLLLSDRDVLEPTALEKLWMYLQFHPAVSSVRSLSFDEASLRTTVEGQDSMHVKFVQPMWNHTTITQVTAVPMLYDDHVFASVEHESDMDGGNVWKPLVSVLSNGRLLREPLYTTVASIDGIHDSIARPSMLSLQHAGITKRETPPQLYSDLAFYKWSARAEEDEMYNETFVDIRHLDIRRIAIGEVDKPAVKRVMFLMPWIDMGGSEKAMLDLADRMLSMKWSVSFVFTMPNWKEDSLGEMFYANAWWHKALSLTSDVVNLVALAPNHLTSKAFRYVLESRKPDIVINSNTRWAYGHSALIRAIVPNAVVADYNHMIHPLWFGGGLPRYGANNSHYFDVHFTASKDVAASMEKWIDYRIMQQNPHKVKPCYIGTDPNMFYTGLQRNAARIRQRLHLNISEHATVVLFAGRFVAAKGTDVMAHLVKKSNSDVNLVGKFFFLFVGDGSQRFHLELLKQEFENVLVLPPAQTLLQMRDYYAMSDVLLLPSVNEGIALVLYEAMASELLVVTTDVGGQSELVTPDSGILIPNDRMVAPLTSRFLDALRGLLTDPEKHDKIRATALERVRSAFTTGKFCDCVIDGVQSAERQHDAKREPANQETFTKLGRTFVHEARIERGDGVWKRGLVARKLYRALTIGIKTYVCDVQTVDQVHNLVRTIRANYPEVTVLLGNDGPTSLADEEFVKEDAHTQEVRLVRDSGISVGRNTLVNMTTTKYFLLLDDDHVVDDSTNFVRVVSALEKGRFDIVGLRVRNLPGIEELERSAVNIPRYVARIQSFKERNLLLCLWNENEGPSVYKLEDAIKVDVLHNAFMAKTDVLRAHGWRDELQVNEHMTFFLDAWRARLRVGYLPSEFVHHRARIYSKCYYSIRFREHSFRPLLDYEDRFLYDLQCGANFPKMVRRHMGRGLDMFGDDDGDDDWSKDEDDERADTAKDKDEGEDSEDMVNGVDDDIDGDDDSADRTKDEDVETALGEVEDLTKDDGDDWDKESTQKVVQVDPVENVELRAGLENI